ncbi:FeoA family protein [Vagococcus sp.]|uniref:FeoA family protein n=1 Tax=Vagococcus sp. TaxID=1933889 RepID=UPI003F960AFB
MQSLLSCEVNQVYEFVGFHGALEEERHLRHLGLIEGTTLHIVSRLGQQSLIILFGETRLGLDAQVASQMLVVKKGNVGLSQTTTLALLPVGATTRVVKVLGQGPIKRRLMDMGLTKGTPITLQKLAPLGDPLEVTLRNYELTLRKAEAELILVEKEANE